MPEQKIKVTVADVPVKQQTVRVQVLEQSREPIRVKIHQRTAPTRPGRKRAGQKQGDRK